MPEILILNPNDQPTGKWRLINELRESLNDPDFDTLTVTFDRDVSDASTITLCSASNKDVI